MDFEKPVDKMAHVSTFIDLQTTGDVVDGKVIDMVYDTILMKKDDNTIYIMWTARTEGNYYRFYCPFTVSDKKLGEIRVNRFKAGDVINDFSASVIKFALAEKGILCKKMYSDIGIMQKLSSRTENGETYYTGTYSGDFTCIIKIDTDNIANSEVVLQAKMHTSCFYPYIQYYEGGELAMSYTVARKHIRLAQFTLSKYL